jgi:hypothetical protein
MSTASNIEAFNPFIRAAHWPQHNLQSLEPFFSMALFPPPLSVAAILALTAAALLGTRRSCRKRSQSCENYTANRLTILSGNCQLRLSNPDSRRILCKPRVAARVPAFAWERSTLWTMGKWHDVAIPNQQSSASYGREAVHAIGSP